MADGGAVVCEIELRLDGWFDQVREEHRQYDGKYDSDDGNDGWVGPGGGASYLENETAAREQSAAGEGSTGRWNDGEARGVEDILALCVAMKHDVPIYISRDVLDRFSMHPSSWRSSFCPGSSQSAGSQKKVRTAPTGYIHTPANSDPDDPDIFEIFLHDMLEEIERRPETAIRAHTIGQFHFTAYESANDGFGPDIGKSVNRLTRILLKGPVFFFFLVLHFWKTWQRRWYGFKEPPPSLAVQTGKHGGKEL